MTLKEVQEIVTNKIKELGFERGVCTVFYFDDNGEPLEYKQAIAKLIKKEFVDIVVYENSVIPGVARVAKMFLTKNDLDKLIKGEIKQTPAGLREYLASKKE